MAKQVGPPLSGPVPNTGFKSLIGDEEKEGDFHQGHRSIPDKQAEYMSAIRHYCQNEQSPCERDGSIYVWSRIRLQPEGNPKPETGWF